MVKDFDGWNSRKKILNGRFQAPFYHEREVWWCVLGINVGFEQDGSGREYYRPVIVLKGLSRHTCLAVPLTTSKKEHPMRLSAGIVGGRETKALISQLRTVDAKRLFKKIGYLEEAVFLRIRKAVKDML